VLISPLPLDTPTAPGFVPSRPLSRGGTTGFSDQLAAADSALSGPSFSPRPASPEEQSVPDEDESRGLNGAFAMRTPVAMASRQLAGGKSGRTTALSVQTVPGRNVMATPVTRGSGPDVAIVSAQAPRPRANRQADSADENAKDSYKNDGQPAALPLPPVPAAAVRNTGSAPTPVPAPAAADPTPAVAGYAERGYAERAENQIGALAAEQPLLKDALAAAPTPDAATDETPDSGVEQLAFAVKVQPGKSMAALPRIAAPGSFGSVNQTAPESNADDSSQSPKVHAARPDVEAHSNEDTADASDADKKAATGGDAKQSAEAADGSLTPHPGALIEEASSHAGTAAGLSDSSHPSKTAGPSEAAAPEPLLRPTGPMKDLSVRVESAQGQSVDIRIVQRAGDLQIAVKSDDTNTTQGLRQGLTELSNRLNESGYQAETWRPGHAVATAESAAESGNSSQHQPPSGDAQSNPGSSHQNRGQRDNNPSNRPRWIQELESNLAGGTTSTFLTGQSHGLNS